MKSWPTLILAIAAAVCLVPVTLLAGAGEDRFEQGQALLAEADFEGAMQAFADAARSDRGNSSYMQHYAMTRQVILLRRQLDEERDDARWEYMARGLHSFYAARGLQGELLQLDQRMHDRLGTATSAVTLAETQLAHGMLAEATETVAKLPADRQTASSRALHGIALARQGKVEQAQQIAATIPADDLNGPGALLRAARLHAAAGSAEQAIAMLTRCFESVAPSQLDAYKQHAKGSPDFHKLVETPAFTVALQTESKVKESSCSGGTRCSTCPMRGKCSGSRGN